MHLIEILSDFGNAIEIKSHTNIKQPAIIDRDNNVEKVSACQNMILQD